MRDKTYFDLNLLLQTRIFIHFFPDLPFFLNFFFDFSVYVRFKILFVSAASRSIAFSADDDSSGWLLNSDGNSYLPDLVGYLPEKPADVIGTHNREFNSACLAALRLRLLDLRFDEFSTSMSS